MDGPKFMGVVALMYSKLELTLELIAARKLGISARQSHIVFANMNMGTKQGVVRTLLKEDDTEESKAISETIKRAFDLMRRNHIFHSIMTFGPSDRIEAAKFYKREANDGLKVRTHSLEAEEMREVSHAFIDEVSKLMDQCSISEDDLRSYVSAVV